MPSNASKPMFKDDVLRPAKRRFRVLVRGIEQTVSRNEDPTDLVEQLADEARELHGQMLLRGLRWVEDAQAEQNPEDDEDLI